MHRRAKRGDAWSTTLARALRWRIRRYVPVLATLALLLVLYAIGASQYTAFSNIQVVLNVFIDNGFLLVVAVGMTFVILTGGIDLSVGSVVAMTAMVCASLLRADLPARWCSSSRWRSARRSGSGWAASSTSSRSSRSS
jgi:ribose/xylose/arabinose/galactoside ABC-type transport system permease subunit